MGEGAVWVLNQADGSVSRIEPESNKVVATIEAGVKGFGGDIAAGEGFVWVRGDKILLVVIDPKTNKVIKRYGPPQGSGAVRAGRGKVWVSAARREQGLVPGPAPLEPIDGPESTIPTRLEGILWWFL